MDPSRIKVNSLPGFIRMSGAMPDKLSYPMYEASLDEGSSRHSCTVPSRKLEDVRSKVIWERSNTCSGVTSPDRLDLQISKPVKARVTPIEIYLRSINDPLRDPREVIVTIRFYELTRADLRNWVESSPDASNVVDAYFSVLQERSKTTSDAEGPRFLMANSDISAAILSRSDSLHSSNYVFRYDRALYPVFKRHWSLLAVDLRERKVTYYDPTKRNEDLSDTLVKLFRFFKSEMAHHEHRNIEETTWRDFTYRSPETLPKFAAQDSAAFICKLGEGLVSGERVQLQACLASEYRKEVLHALVAHSLKL
jgi:hypothetical protein